MVESPSPSLGALTEARSGPLFPPPPLPFQVGLRRLAEGRGPHYSLFMLSIIVIAEIWRIFCSPELRRGRRRRAATVQKG